MIDTPAAEYRTLQFNSLSDVRRELDAIEAARRAGTLRTSGNWSPSQIATHLAAFINYAYDGYPPAMRSPPWIIRLILKLVKNRYLYKPMPRGLKIPRIKGGTVGQEEVPFEEGIARLRAALLRLERTAPTRESPIFGPMSHAEWKALQTRHCELHLGYLHPR